MAAPVPHSARVVRLARRPPPSPARNITASAGLPSARPGQAPVARQGSLAYELSHIVPDASSPAVDVAPAIQEAGAIQEVGAKGNVFQRVRTLLRLFSTGVLRSVAALINDPVGAVDRMREAVLPLIQKVPLALEKVLHEDLAPAFDSAVNGLIS